MAEVRAVRGTNGLKFASTFSGCGGSCLGFEMAGFEPVFASEFVEAARDTYRANHHGVHVDERDIRDVTADDILKQTGLAVGELDVFEGSPPCKSFSFANHGHKGVGRAHDWGKSKSYSDDQEQRADDLFFEWARLLDGLQPRAFVAENVPGLTAGKAVGYFKIIVGKLAACGYRVRVATLDASWLGVPQARRRLIFVGTRNDLEVEPPMPAPLPYRYGVRDALHDIVEGEVMAWVDIHRQRRDSTNKIVFQYNDPDSPIATIVASVNMSFVNPSFYERGILVAPHGCLEDLSLRPEWFRGPKPQEGNRMFASSKRENGAIEPRILTLEELRRVCSFPADFELTGKQLQQWERLGRAVPPVMAMHVAAAVRDTLLSVADRGR
jgi:DNA (cytosine-5)-methyltransferase 1